MSRQLQNIELSITLEAPYLVHGNDPGRFGLDATLLLDPFGQPILPGTLLAGRIAEIWQTYGATFDNANPDTWFGKPDTAGSASQPQRARLMVSDLVLTQLNGQPYQKQTTGLEITRTQLDEDTGSVKQGALLLIEQISQPGAELEFKGCWQVWATQDETPLLAQQIRAALLAQTQLGAYRGIGFGRMRGCTVTNKPVAAKPLPLTRPDSQRIRLGLSFDAPICVNARSRRGNVFISGDTIPGNTILGALAQTLMHQHARHRLEDIKESPLAQHFSALRCTHALPSAPEGGRPVPLAQSLVHVDGKVRDAFTHATAPELPSAPAFQTDWKDTVFALASEHRGWPQTARHLRVRTALKDGKAEVEIKDGKAGDGKLFAYDCVFAPPKDGQPTVQWQFDLDLQAVPKEEHTKLLDELSTLLGSGLAPIGKTDARAQVQQQSNPQEVWPSNVDGLSAGSLVQMVLVSDALLFPTDSIADQPGVDLTQIYREAFADLAHQAGQSDAITLSHIFATQRLSGGNYLQRRYLHQNTKGYQPLVLTQAGSVFVFEVQDTDRAKKLLEQWHSQGLPLPQAVINKHGHTWQHHPYITQNGYGEVVINPKHPFETLKTA